MSIPIQTKMLFWDCPASFFAPAPQAAREGLLLQPKPSTGRLPSSQLTMRTPSLLKRFTCTEAESRYDGLDFTIYLSNLLSSNLVYSNTSINQSIKLSNHIKPSKHRSINLYLLHVYLSYLSLPLLFFSDAPLVSWWWSPLWAPHNLCVAWLLMFFQELAPVGLLLAKVFLHPVG